MLRRERHKLLLLASDPAGLAMVPESQAEINENIHKIQCSFHAHYRDTPKRTDVINLPLSPLNLPLLK